MVRNNKRKLEDDSPPHSKEAKLDPTLTNVIWNIDYEYHKSLVKAKLTSFIDVGKYIFLVKDKLQLLEDVSTHNILDEAKFRAQCANNRLANQDEKNNNNSNNNDKNSNIDDYINSNNDNNNNPNDATSNHDSESLQLEDYFNKFFAEGYIKTWKGLIFLHLSSALHFTQLLIDSLPYRSNTRSNCTKNYVTLEASNSNTTNDIFRDEDPTDYYSYWLAIRHMQSNVWLPLCFSPYFLLSDLEPLISEDLVSILSEWKLVCESELKKSESPLSTSPHARERELMDNFDQCIKMLKWNPYKQLINTNTNSNSNSSTNNIFELLSSYTPTAHNVCENDGNIMEIDNQEDQQQIIFKQQVTDMIRKSKLSEIGVLRFTKYLKVYTEQVQAKKESPSIDMKQYILTHKDIIVNNLINFGLHNPYHRLLFDIGSGNESDIFVEEYNMNNIIKIFDVYSMSHINKYLAKILNKYPESAFYISLYMLNRINKEKTTEINKISDILKNIIEDVKKKSKSKKSKKSKKDKDKDNDADDDDYSNMDDEAIEKDLITKNSYVGQLSHQKSSLEYIYHIKLEEVLNILCDILLVTIEAFLLPLDYQQYSKNKQNMKNHANSSNSNNKQDTDIDIDSNGDVSQYFIPIRDRQIQPCVESLVSLTSRKCIYTLLNQEDDTNRQNLFDQSPTPLKRMLIPIYCLVLMILHHTYNSKALQIYTKIVSQTQRIGNNLDEEISWASVMKQFQEYEDNENETKNDTYTYTISDYTKKILANIFLIETIKKSNQYVDKKPGSTRLFGYLSWFYYHNFHNNSQMEHLNVQNLLNYTEGDEKYLINLFIANSIPYENEKNKRHGLVLKDTIDKHIDLENILIDESAISVAKYWLNNLIKNGKIHLGTTLYIVNFLLGYKKTNIVEDFIISSYEDINSGCKDESNMRYYNPLLSKTFEIIRRLMITLSLRHEKIISKHNQKDNNNNNNNNRNDANDDFMNSDANTDTNNNTSATNDKNSQVKISDELKLILQNDSKIQDIIYRATSMLDVVRIHQMLLAPKYYDYAYNHVNITNWAENAEVIWKKDANSLFIVYPDLAKSFIKFMSSIYIKQIIDPKTDTRSSNLFIISFSSALLSNIDIIKQNIDEYKQLLTIYPCFPWCISLLSNSVFSVDEMCSILLTSLQKNTSTPIFEDKYLTCILFAIRFNAPKLLDDIFNYLKHTKTLPTYDIDEDFEYEEKTSITISFNHMGYIHKSIIARMKKYNADFEKIKLGVIVDFLANVMDTFIAYEDKKTMYEVLESIDDSDEFLVKLRIAILDKIAFDKLQFPHIEDEITHIIETTIEMMTNNKEIPTTGWKSFVDKFVSTYKRKKKLCKILQDSITKLGK